MGVMWHDYKRFLDKSFFKMIKNSDSRPEKIVGTISHTFPLTAPLVVLVLGHHFFFSHELVS